MTDNEIIKALECCVKGLECKNCPANPHKGNYGYCTSLLLKAALDLINRQKAEIFKEKNKNSKLRNERNRLKAEVERLQTENKLLIDNDVSNKYPNCVLVEKGRIYTKALEDYDNLIGDISAEAIKEFAERLKENSIATFSWNGVVLVEEIDNLLKEMESDNDE